MCKVYKYCEKTDSKTNPYVFQSFNISYAEKTERENVSIDVPERYYRNIEKLEQKIQKLKKEADSIIKSAELEAEKIVEAANQEAMSVLNESSMEGYKNGLSIANKKTDEVIRNTNLEAMEILETAKLNSEKIINDLEDEILDFSFDIAKKILDVEIDRNDEVFAAVINKALLRIRTDTAARIIMQADDLKRLENHGIDKAFSDMGKPNLQFVSDKDIKKCGIIIETDRGTVDASVNSQFLKIKSAIVQKKISVI